MSCFACRNAACDRRARKTRPLTCRSPSRLQHSCFLPRTQGATCRAQHAGEQRVAATGGPHFADARQRVFNGDRSDLGSNEERGERQPRPESCHRPAACRQPWSVVVSSRSVGQSGSEQSRLRVHAVGRAPSKEPSPSADHASALGLGSWPGQKCVGARETTRVSNCEPSCTRGSKHARGDARILAAGRAPGTCETIVTITFECLTAIEHRRDLGAACDVGTVQGTVRAAPNLELVEHGSWRMR